MVFRVHVLHFHLKRRTVLDVFTPYSRHWILDLPFCFIRHLSLTGFGFVVLVGEARHCFLYRGGEVRHGFWEGFGRVRTVLDKGHDPLELAQLLLGCLQFPVVRKQC